MEEENNSNGLTMNDISVHSTNTITSGTTSTTPPSTTISLQNDPNHNKNKLTSKGEDSGSVLQPVLVPQLGYSTIQNILDINKKLIKVLIEYQNYGWIEDPDFIIYQRRLQTNLNYLATVADNYLNFNNISIPDLSPVAISKKLLKKMEEREQEKKRQTKNKNEPSKASTTAINTTQNPPKPQLGKSPEPETGRSSPSSPKINREIKQEKVEEDRKGSLNKGKGGLVGEGYPKSNNKNKDNKSKKRRLTEEDENDEEVIEEEEEEEEKEEEEEEEEEKAKGINDDTSKKESSLVSSPETIFPSLPPPSFISDPNIYDQTELDNVSPIDPGSYVAIQPFVIPECIKRPPAVDKSKDVGYLTPGVTRAIFKGRWEGLTLGGNNNPSSTNTTN